MDKTALLQKLVAEGNAYFLARPRRFGKSLTISTLHAMLTGNATLFDGLAAFPWVTKQSQHPSPVLLLDFSTFDSNGSAQALTKWLNRKLTAFAAEHAVSVTAEASCAETLDTVLHLVSQHQGPVAVLIDEYDAPILDNLDNPEKIQDFRKVLRQFYKVLKASSSSLCFTLITGISLFTKNSIFSASNNLIDISAEEEYRAITGYTQKELEEYFSAFIEQAVAKKVMSTRESLLQKLQRYYDGFSFDGITKVYNPFSLLSFFRKYKFSNYWYESGSTTFIESYFKKHNIEYPEKYHLIRVQSLDMAPKEIESASPESFLYQAGYLTIASSSDDTLILDYPNQEVTSSLSHMYLSAIYPIAEHISIGKKLWQAVRTGDICTLALEYNAAIASLPYHDLAKHTGKANPKHDESFYRALFLMLLRACGVQTHGEMPTCRGRSDVVIPCPERILVIEFNLAKNATEIASKHREGEEQIRSQGYLEPYATSAIPVSSAVFVVNAEKRQIALCQDMGCR